MGPWLESIPSDRYINTERQSAGGGGMEGGGEGWALAEEWREVSHEERNKNKAGPQSELDHGEEGRVKSAMWGK